MHRSSRNLFTLDTGNLQLEPRPSQGKPTEAELWLQIQLPTNCVQTGSEPSRAGQPSLRTNMATRGLASTESAPRRGPRTRHASLPTAQLSPASAPGQARHPACAHSHKIPLTISAVGTRVRTPRRIRPLRVNTFLTPRPHCLCNPGAHTQPRPSVRRAEGTAGSSSAPRTSCG